MHLKSRRRSQVGVVLIVVIGVLALLSLLAATFGMLMSVNRGLNPDHNHDLKGPAHSCVHDRRHSGRNSQQALLMKRERFYAKNLRPQAA